jgi:regulator of sigma E protease
MNEFEITPYLEEEGEPRLGVYLGSSAQIFYQEPLQRIFAGFLHTYNVLDYSINGLGQLISISFSEGTAEPISEGVSGPIGIYSLVDNIVSYSQAEVLLDLIDLMALISVSLAFLNVLPLPALDGGRVLFVIIELIRGKRVSPKLEAGVHKFGILVLLSLLVLVSIRDVIRIF